MPVEPLPSDDMRQETLVFADHSEIQVNAFMRSDEATVYRNVCQIAVDRRFTSVIDAKQPLRFPTPIPEPETAKR